MATSSAWGASSHCTAARAAPHLLPIPPPPFPGQEGTRGHTGFHGNTSHGTFSSPSKDAAQTLKPEQTEDPEKQGAQQGSKLIFVAPIPAQC
ncbi:hypothetical protein MDA_GLEAN10001705 [Myotis davidii]|uniref:Uncharacterized protein n=1 Tax=Myotis davidii TaxID=225400 RepID=L5LSH6_MYODS|nr:hypothetical protein MDA_GLEAN10001705 [Myotis davidii]